MNKNRKPRVVAAHAEGIKQLIQAQAASQDEEGESLSYEQIAEEAKVSSRTVQRCFNQERIRLSSAYAIAKVLGLDVETVFDFSEIEKHNRQPSEDKSASVEPTNVSDLQQACYELLERQRKLTISSLMANGGIALNLDDVFVPLGLLQRRKRSERDDIDSAEHGSRLYNVAKEDIVQQFNHQQFFEQVIRDGNTPQSKGKRIAIIGEPGAGKTTQLQKIGDWILEETDGIPILISLSALGQKSLREYLSDDWLQTAASDLDVSQHHRDDLAQLLKTGKVWLLLDGIDEMTVADALHHIATQMREGWLQNVRVVLTCRLNVWDAGKNALDDFDVYRNLDFEYPTEVHQFIDKWFWDKPDLQQQLKDALEQPGKERIRDMVKNPLRLTLLCYSWHIRQGKLPETKAGLYEWFVDVFYDWNQEKVPVKLNSAKRRELNQALGELAREAIDQDSSRFRLPEQFITDFLGDADDEDSLFYLALQLGWLNCIGVAAENQFKKVYAFFHPTFQEYFAALAIDDWDYFLPREHKDKPVEGRKYRIFEPQWKEISCFWVEINPSVSDDLIEKIYSVDNTEIGRFVGYYHYSAIALTVVLIIHLPSILKKYFKILIDVVQVALKDFHGSDHIIPYWHGLDPKLITEIIRFIIEKSFNNYKEPEYLLRYFDILLSLQPDNELNFRLLAEAEKILLDDFKNAGWLKERIGGLYLKYKSDHPKAAPYKKIPLKSVSAKDFVQLMLSISDYISKEIEGAREKLEKCTTNDLIERIIQLTENEEYNIECIGALEYLSENIMISGDEYAINFLLDLSLTNNPQKWKHDSMINFSVFKVANKYPSIVTPILRKYFDDESFRKTAMSQTCYAELLFRCAKNMRYSDFYQIWCGLSN